MLKLEGMASSKPFPHLSKFLCMIYQIADYKTYETVPFLLHLMVTDFEKSLDILPKDCVAVAFAVAEFPLLLEETDLIFQVLAGQVVLWE